MAWIIAIVLMNLYIFTQTPSEWRHDRRVKTLMLIVLSIGCCAFIIMTIAFNRMDDGAFKSFILYTSTIYYSWTAVAFWIVLLRKFLFYSIRHFNSVIAMNLLGNKALFIVLAVAITIAYTAGGINNINHLVETTYTIDVDKSGKCDDMTIALVSDIHSGSGANEAVLQEMKEKINRMNADICIIAGDMFDVYTSKTDIEKTCDAFAEVKTKYGVIYVDGNHDYDCKYEWKEAVKAAGVVTLNNKAIQLDNGVAIVGISYSPISKESKTNAARLVNQAGISEEAPCILVKHYPKKLAEVSKGSDVVLCGHTHGYQYPNVAFYSKFVFDNPYGLKQCGDAQCITTSGVGAWCFHAKWPSHSEVVRLELRFGDK